MKNVLVRLKEYSSQANGAEKFLIRFILEYPEDAVKLVYMHWLRRLILLLPLSSGFAANLDLKAIKT